MGRIRFVFFYLICGLVAAAAQLLINPASHRFPWWARLARSSGVLGAYLVLYPRVRVHVLIILFIFIQVITVPAWMMLIWWFGLPGCSKDFPVESSQSGRLGQRGGLGAHRRLRVGRAAHQAVQERPAIQRSRVGPRRCPRGVGSGGSCAGRSVAHDGSRYSPASHFAGGLTERSRIVARKSPCLSSNPSARSRAGIAPRRRGRGWPRCAACAAHGQREGRASSLCLRSAVITAFVTDERRRVDVPRCSMATAWPRSVDINPAHHLSAGAKPPDPHSREARQDGQRATIAIEDEADAQEDLACARHDGAREGTLPAPANIGRGSPSPARRPRPAASSPAIAEVGQRSGLHPDRGRRRQARDQPSRARGPKRRVTRGSRGGWRPCAGSSRCARRG